MLDLERVRGGEGGSSYLAIGGEAESRQRGSGRERAREEREGGGERKIHSSRLCRSITPRSTILNSRTPRVVFVVLGLPKCRSHPDDDSFLQLGLKS